MGSDIRAGAAFVELYVKGSFHKDLADIGRKLKSFGDGLTSIGKKMLGVGTAILAPLALAVHQFDNMGDAVNKASQRTGVAVESLSALKYAAEQSGASFEDLEGAIRKMEKSIFSAEGGSKEAEKTLAGLGLTVADLKNLSPDKQFSLIADRLSKVGDAGAKASIAMELFGRGGTKMLPLMDQGAAGIAALTARAKELGLVISKDDAEAATKFGDTLEDLYKQFKAIIFTVGATIAQALQPFATAAIGIMTKTIQWIGVNRQLVLAVLGVGLAFVAAGAALIVFGFAITKLVAIGSAIAAIFSFISGTIALLMNPIVLVSVAIIGLGIYFAYATGVIGECVDWLKAKFTELKATFGEMLGGISDALAAGDIQLAAEILWVGLKLLWAKGTKELMEYWIATCFNIQELWINTLANTKTTTATWAAAMGDTWDGFANIAETAFDRIVSSYKMAFKMMTPSGMLNEEKIRKQEALDLFNREADRNAGAQASIAKRAAELKKALAKVETDRAAALNKNDNDSINKIIALNKKEADLKAQLAELRAKAADEAGADAAARAIKAAIAAGSGKTLLPPEMGIDNALSNQLASPTAKSAVMFNMRGIQGLESSAGDDYAKQIVKNTADIVKNTKNTAKFK